MIQLRLTDLGDQLLLWGVDPVDSLALNPIFSKYSSRPTTILAVIVWGRGPNTITSNLSEVEMNTCIIVYLAFE